MARLQVTDESLRGRDLEERLLALTENDHGAELEVRREQC